MRRLIVGVLLLAAILTGCGGKQVDPMDTVAAQLAQYDDQGQVAQAEIDLANGAINGGDLPALAEKVAAKLRQSTSEGVSATWVNGQIDRLELVYADCDRCFTELEAVRS